MRLDIPLVRYEACVLDNPRHPGEGAIAYISRVAELAAGAHLSAPARDFPETRMPYREAE